MNNEYLMLERMNGFNTRHIDTKCAICECRIYEDILCTMCQFRTKLTIKEQNKLREILYKLDLARLKLAVKGIGAVNPYAALSVNTFKV